MAWYTNLLSSSVDKVVSATGAALDNLFTSDDEKGKNKIAMMQIAVAAEQSKRELEEKLEEAYLKDADSLRQQIKSEVESQDPYVRRGRPSFLYVFYLIIIFNYIVFPILTAFNLPGQIVINIPGDLWAVFGVGYIGYGFMRSYDKAGGTEIPLPFRTRK
jgi:hypothetical protein